jgi:hypothetical protein
LRLLEHALLARSSLGLTVALRLRLCTRIGGSSGCSATTIT